LIGTTQVQGTANKMPTNGNDPCANVKDNPPAEVNAYCSFKNKPTSHVLLAMAIVEVRNRWVNMHHVVFY
jgi:hypothetical protein